MSTTTHTPGDLLWRSQKSDTAEQAARFAAVLVPFARILFSTLFLFLGYSHFTNEAISYASLQGTPTPNILVPLTGVFALIGGMSILLGYRARIGALLIILFLIPATLMMHRYWIIEDPLMRQVQMAHFFKNISLLGGSILICFFGSGPSDLDSWLENRKRLKNKSSPKTDSTSFEKVPK